MPSNKSILRLIISIKIIRHNKNFVFKCKISSDSSVISIDKFFIEYYTLSFYYYHQKAFFGFVGLMSLATGFLLKLLYKLRVFNCLEKIEC